MTAGNQPSTIPFLHQSFQAREDPLHRPADGHPSLCQPWRCGRAHGALSQSRSPAAPVASYPKAQNI